MPIDEYGNKVQGFYLIGFFTKHKPSRFTVQSKKPFTTDLNGESSSVCFTGYKCNEWASDWMFIENHKTSDIDKDLELRKELNEVFKDWCIKHKRKNIQILFEDEKREEK